MKAKPAASRASKHKKKYWRKGTGVSEFDAVNAATSSAQEEPKDEDLFEIDRVPTEEKKKLKFTRRQQASLDRISAFSGKFDDELPQAKAPRRLETLRKPVARNDPSLPDARKSAKKFDLWEADFTPKVAMTNEVAVDHLLRTTKKKQPKQPSTVRHIRTLRNAVDVAAAGASYNPDAAAYHEYVDEIAKKEQKVIDKELRMAKLMKPEKESMVTHEERYLEEVEGLTVHPKYNEDDTVIETKEENDDQLMETDESKLEKPKTKKQKLAEKKAEQAAKLSKKKKDLEVAQHQIYRVKAITKEIQGEEVALKKRIVENKKKRLMNKLAGPQKLGRGTFDEEDVFLAQDELTSSLRELKPQGSVLLDRFRSMQKRNMLPVEGKRTGKKLKTKLKKKAIERRNVKDVKKGSRVI